MKMILTSAAAMACLAGSVHAEMNADEVRSVVAEMLADADSRASLLQGGGSAGWDKGFFIESADGDFKLKVSGQFQFQFVANSNDSAMGDDYDHDFVNRRTKLTFAGKIYDEWGFKINGGFSRATGAFGLQDAYVTNEISDGVTLKLGQFKAPFLAEESNSSSRLLGAERSYTNEWFTTGRNQGLMLSGGDDTWRWSLGLTDGANVRSMGRNGEFSNTDLGTVNTDAAVTGRVEFLWGENAEWGQFKDMTATAQTEHAGRLGAAVHYQQGSDVGGMDEQTSLSYTVDAWMEFEGASVQLFFVGQSIEDEGGVAGADTDQYGFGVQGGLHLVPDEWELFGRYEFIDFDDAFAGTGRDDSLSLFTVGVVHYIHGHSVKWTNQVTFAFDEVPSGTTSTALVTDAPGEDGQVGFISQIQLLF